MMPGLGSEWQKESMGTFGFGGICLEGKPLDQGRGPANVKRGAPPVGEDDGQRAKRAVKDWPTGKLVCAAPED
jgi:hypothetical protein